MHPIKSLLILAPHLEFPLENGADILVGNRIDGFLKTFENVTIIGNGFVSTYFQSRNIKTIRFKNSFLTKNMSALRTIFTNKSYLYNKFLTSRFLRRIQKDDIANIHYDVVYYSFIHTADACSSFFKKVKLQIIETHNDDVVWYSNLLKNSNNLLSKLVSYKSILYTKRFLSNSNEKFIYIALNDNDKLGYLDYISESNLWLIPGGIKIPEKVTLSRSVKKNEIKLIFVGSLNVKMNYDALHYFSRNFHKHIINAIKTKVTVNIAGRNPTDKIKKLCSEYSWVLSPNVSDSELSNLLGNSDFMILPFPYTTGTKMKLLEAFSHNLPILATKIISKQINLTRFKQYSFGIFSDSASGWIQCINNFSKTNNLKDIAEEYSSENVNKLLFENIINEI